MPDAVTGLKLGLRSRSVVLVTGVVTLAVALASVLLIWQFNESTNRIRDLSTASLRAGLTDSLRDEAIAMLRDQAKRSVDAVVEGRKAALLPAVERLARDTTTLSASWWSADGTLLAHAGEPTPGAPPPRIDGTLRTTSRTGQSGDVLIITAPVMHKGVTVGALRGRYSLDAVERQAVQLDARLSEVIGVGKQLNWTHVLTASGLSLAFALVLALLVARQLILPIRRLADYAAAVGLGHHSAPLPVERTDELGDLARSLRDMSDNLQETTGEVHYLAYHDSLTQLPNRAQLKQSLRQAIGRGEREEHSVALLFIDLDDFKRVNDTLGHEAGDELLREVALRLRACLREGDEVPVGPRDSNDAIEPRETIARLGGDEFTVVLNNVRESGDTAAVAQRILDALREPFVLGGQEVVVGASIGITTFPEDGADVDALLRNADVAMYQAKSRGKNHFEFYNDSMHRMATERLSLETDLRHAIDYEQMRVLYQPIVEAQSRQLVGIDAQVRWIHPALGTILPDVFLPLAEQSGFIVPMDRWLIDQVCADLAALDELGHHHVDVAASLGSVHFRDHAIGESVVSALNRHRVDPSRLALAIREKTLMQNEQSASAMLAALRERGVHAWIDDFGNGHSPLRVLPRLAMDGVRMNSQHVNAQSRDADTKAIIATIVAMAHTLNLKVTATGVETAEQLELLREVGCDYAQGSLIVRPMLLADLVTWLSRQGAEATAQTGTSATVPFPGPRHPG
ncbi:MAG: EAL domain-containing protein [Pseudomonadota bacterium]